MSRLKQAFFHFDDIALKFITVTLGSVEFRGVKHTHVMAEAPSPELCHPKPRLCPHLTPCPVLPESWHGLPVTGTAGTR